MDTWPPIIQRRTSASHLSDKKDHFTKDQLTKEDHFDSSEVVISKPFIPTLPVARISPFRPFVDSPAISSSRSRRHRIGNSELTTPRQIDQPQNEIQIEQQLQNEQERLLHRQHSTLEKEDKEDVEKEDVVFPISPKGPLIAYTPEMEYQKSLEDESSSVEQQSSRTAPHIVPRLPIQLALNLSSIRMGTPRTPHTPRPNPCFIASHPFEKTHTTDHLEFEQLLYRQQPVWTGRNQEDEKVSNFSSQQQPIVYEGTPVLLERHVCCIKQTFENKWDSGLRASYHASEQLKRSLSEREIMMGSIESIMRSSETTEDNGLTPVRLFVGRIPKPYKSNDLKKWDICCYYLCSISSMSE